MRLTALSLALLALAGVRTPAPAADPIDEKLAALAAAEKSRAESEKAVAAIKADLLKLYEGYHAKLVAAGVIAPGPPPPAPPPKPVDQLKQKLRAAFEADGGKLADALQLAALYREAGKLAASPDVPSTAELLRRVREAGASLVSSPDALKGLRKVVAEELMAALGKSTDEPITGDERTAAAALFARLAETLESFQEK